MITTTLFRFVFAAAVAVVAGVQDRVVVLLGDSTTVSAESVAGEKYADAVGDLLAQSPGLGDVRVVNSGKGGDTARGALARVDAEVAAHDPDAVVVSFGLNDLGKVTPEEFGHDLRRLAEAIRARTRAEVILATSTPFDDRHVYAGKEPYLETGSLDATFDRTINDTTRVLARQRGWALCDPHRAFTEAAARGDIAMTDLLREDGVHLTTKGNRLMAETVVPAIIAALGEARQTGFPGVLPRPKEYREAGEPVVLAPAGQAVRIKVYGADPVLRTAQRALTERVEKLGGSVDSVEGPPVVRFGVTSDWPAEGPELQVPPVEKPQGYTLSVSPGAAGATPTIAIRGSDPLGTYYGVQTLIQLLDRSPAGITVRPAQVRDWPTFTFRLFKGQCWYFRDNQMYVEWMSRFKWNVFGSCYTDSPDWRAPSEAYRAMIERLCTTATREGTVRVMQLGNPYMLKEKAIRASAAGDVETLAAFFEPSLSNGSDSLMLCLDDFAYLPTEDSGQFQTLAGANTDIVNRFAKAIWSRHPGTRILLCPPPYWLTANKARGYEWAHEYLRELSAAIPPQIAIVWTGLNVTTVRHQPAEIEAYQQLVGPERQLFLWDNTLKMPPGWGNVFRQNAFLAACNDVADSAWPDLAAFTNGEAGINTYGPGEVYKVPLMTAADYLWNPEDYDPQDAMRRALYWGDENPAVGPLVYRWTNSLHQRLYTQRLAFLASPSAEGLDGLRRLTDEYERLFERIVAETKNETLVASLRPYLRRHVDSLPILADVLAAVQQRQSDSAEAGKRLEASHTALTALAHTLRRGEPAEDRHGCVQQHLETLSLKAIDALRAEAKKTP
ncbi:MAG: beta-N-acetylglucosaminidase domain-containing protein [Phycisphaerae bacterium]|nr:beta-N-acetylglucosaminidase domain-containing protein [Phycisphaerae bacterium]